MFLKPGQRPDHGFDEPLGLLSDCHRRIEHFLDVLIAIHEQTRGGALSAAQRAQLEGAVTYFAIAAPRHTADEEESLFPRLRALDDPAANQVLNVLARLEADHARANVHHRELFPVAGRLLTADELRAVGREMAARRSIHPLRVQ